MEYDGFEFALAGIGGTFVFLAICFGVLWYAKSSAPYYDRDGFMYAFWWFVIPGTFFIFFSFLAANIHGNTVDRYRAARHAYPTLEIYDINPSDEQKGHGTIGFRDGDDRCTADYIWNDGVFTIVDADCSPPPDAYEPQTR